MKVYTQNFSTNLRILRMEKNLTQKELADLLKYSEKTVSKWECGACIPDIDVLSYKNDKLTWNTPLRNVFQLPVITRQLLMKRVYVPLVQALLLRKLLQILYGHLIRCLVQMYGLLHLNLVLVCPKNVLMQF